MNKVIKFKKTKNNIYIVTFSSKAIPLYDDVITKYELLRRKEISDEELEHIEEYNKSLHAYYDALSYLRVKERSSKEVEKYLKKQGYLEDTIKNTISILKEKNYLNEDNYIKLFVGDSIILKLDGPEKIKNKLIDLGIAKDKIEAYLDKIDASVWEEKASKLLNKKNKSSHKESGNIWKQKLEVYLKNNGYNKSHYQRLLDEIVIEDNLAVIEKEMAKWLRKYSTKYEKEELLFKVKQKLYQKGYQKESIEEVMKKVEA